MMVGSRDVQVDRPVKSLRVDDRLVVIAVIVQAHEEAGLFALAQRAGQRALIVLPLLGRLYRCERVAGVEESVAEHEIDGAVVLRSSGFGDDFQACPARARKQDRDRKSTRLNSSHVSISYAVFCLKKKKFI